MCLQVSFREPIEADMAVSMLHGRMFGKKVNYSLPLGVDDYRLSCR